ncbi:hypothetical protein [Pedobacter endophyticus]|uniref:Uncharacterized protein n=1 Tax=Pedobacter endophyticus TaxID=2789740 RepID=A0A7S9L1Z5_9SPHI|nr:hypothetical protein [Pedobacter endophyticus]QPH40661.1 hypothetical protein IZT61_05145 [Pedobacter endophyticus]
MGYIKEPAGIDFVINGKPLTDTQKQTISEFIKAEKKRLAKVKTLNLNDKNIQVNTANG